MVKECATKYGTRQKVAKAPSISLSLGLYFRIKKIKPSPKGIAHGNGEILTVNNDIFM
jgi:hypothetical protein